MKTRKEQLIDQFNPNGIGLKNGNFIGLPFDYETADIILFPVPWDVTVSYHDGTCLGPENILNASYQLDLFLERSPNHWKKGIYFFPSSKSLLNKNNFLRPKAINHIHSLENNLKINHNILNEINNGCQEMIKFVYENTIQLLKDHKKIFLVGGDHSTPFGYLKALSEFHNEFGILQIDAHCDLRISYENFTYSHASIFHNVLEKIPNCTNLVQLGIRDYCESEYIRTKEDKKITLFTDQYINQQLFNGATFDSIIDTVINNLPDKIYISFDIDGLSPDLCPNTGTPVPGGFNFNQALFIIKKLKESNKKIIGGDLCEVNGNNEWDGNVGARLLYHLTTLL